MSAKATTLREQRLFQAANRRFGVLHQRDLRAEGLAAAYHRWPLAAPDGDVHLSTTTSLRSRDGITIHRVAGHLADCVHRSARLVVELDGRAFHERRAQMRADRHRDTDYQLDGHRILRLVWDDLHPDEATRTAGRVRRMLALS
jgi:very-short-patch-repair endonuclease